LLEGLEVEILPGISSLSYFCARCRIPWQDIFVTSCHGRDEGVVSAVQSHSRTFILTGGALRVEGVCKILSRSGLGALTAWAGERLSYPEERMVTATVEELSRDSFADLAVLLVDNPNPVQPIFQAPGLSDDAFIRGKVPMTKEEVRALVVSKLRLGRRDTIWDVGAGTGSVSVECALCLGEGRVYAVERRSEACALIGSNREQFQLSNLYLVEGEAPQVLQNLPAPDSVFIGGSAGALRDIVGVALEKNPAVRIVATAITLETLQEALAALRQFRFQDTEVVQVSVSRSSSVGPYHMMRVENPVYLISMEKPL
jgi:precorrin-6Y C5,15-methyltransferase (decarboxylating)